MVHPNFRQTSWSLHLVSYLHSCGQWPACKWFIIFIYIDLQTVIIKSWLIFHSFVRFLMMSQRLLEQAQVHTLSHPHAPQTFLISNPSNPAQRPPVWPPLRWADHGVPKCTPNRCWSGRSREWPQRSSKDPAKRNPWFWEVECCRLPTSNTTPQTIT